MESTADWKEPFRELRKVIRSTFDLNESLYHTVLLAPELSESDLDEVVFELEANYSGKTLASRIQVPTKSCKYHAHYFFGSKRCYQMLEEALDGIEGWLKAIPEGLLAEFRLPQLFSHHERNVVLWANLVYYLSDKLDCGYLESFVEYQLDSPVGTFELWNTLPQPSEANPLEILIHQGEGENDLASLLSQFQQGNFRFPDVVDAYLFLGEGMIGDFIRSSLIALDGIEFRLEGPVGTGALPSPKSTTKSTRRSRKPRSTSRTDIVILAYTLIAHHQRGTTYDVTRPLIAAEIIELLKSSSSGTQISQPTVNRRMEKLFNSNNPMREYRNILNKNVEALVAYLLIRIRELGDI